MAEQARIRLHIHNDPAGAAVYRVTPDRMAAGAAAHPGLLDLLEISYSDDAASFAAAMAEAEVLLTDSHFDTGVLASGAPKLRWIQCTSAGVEALAPKIPEHVVLTNASGVHGPKGGEYVATGVLMVNHRVPHFATAKEQRRWDQAFATPIRGKTVTMLGVGAIGGEAARILTLLGAEVIGVSRNARPHPHCARVAKPDALAEILPQTDVLASTLPLTPETRGLIGRRELDLLPRHAGVVNVGRSRVIDYAALREKLARGELSGAVLDVFDTEPLPPEAPDWTTPNLILSPHCAVDDSSTYVERCLDILFPNLRRFMAGEALENVVDLRLGY